MEWIADRDAPRVNTGNTVVSEWRVTIEVVWFLLHKNVFKGVGMENFGGEMAAF